MFKRKVKSIAELLPQFLREEGLETPLLQRRLLNAYRPIYRGEVYQEPDTLHQDTESCLACRLVDEPWHVG